MAAKDDLGRWGEQVAADILTAEGLVVVVRNWRCAEGELDIVARNRIGDAVIFCEVKTRSGLGYGTPAESVTFAKRRKIRRLANLWLQANGTPWRAMRFDVIGVLWRADLPPLIDHLEQAF